MPLVRVKENEPFEKALKRFKRQCEKAGIMADVRKRLSDLPGVRAFPVMRQGFGARIQKPVQFVIGGGTYAELAEWRDILLEKIEDSNPGLVGLDWDYKETKPQLQVIIDYDRAAELGVTVSAIGRTLETMLGSRKVTTYIDRGREYDDNNCRMTYSKHERLQPFPRLQYRRDCIRQRKQTRTLLQRANPASPSVRNLPVSGPRAS